MLVVRRRGSRRLTVTLDLDDFLALARRAGLIAVAGDYEEAEEAGLS